MRVYVCVCVCLHANEIERERERESRAREQPRENGRALKFSFSRGIINFPKIIKSRMEWVQYFGVHETLSGRLFQIWIFLQVFDCCESPLARGREVTQERHKIMA